MPALLVTLRALWMTLRRAWRRPEFRGLSLMTIGVIALGTWFYWWREPTITTVLDAFYFTVITLATIGYGDFSPTTPLTKLFTVFYVLIGLAIVAGFLAMIGEQVYEDAVARSRAKQPPAERETGDSAE